MGTKKHSGACRNSNHSADQLDFYTASFFGSAVFRNFLGRRCRNRLHRLITRRVLMGISRLIACRILIGINRLSGWGIMRLRGLCKKIRFRTQIIFIIIIKKSSALSQIVCASKLI